MSFLCSLDLGDTDVPDSWEKALDILKKNFANSMVVRTIPELFHHEVVVVTVHGVGCT